MENSPALPLPPTSKREYTLTDMIAQCDLSAPPPADIVAWDEMNPVGDDVW